MRCQEAQELIGALIDGEVRGEQQLAVSAHVASCSLCSPLAEDYRRIGQRLRAGYAQAPADLADKIRASLAREAEGVRPVARRNWNQFMRQAAVLLFAVASSALASWYLAQHSAQRSLLERDVVTAHVRSLMQDSPTQIASSDSHNVKPWFNGRVDFAPVVKDLAANGFPLAGGRLDLVGGRRVAAVVYKRRQHIIDVFMWPIGETETTNPRLAAPEGYNVMNWSAGGISYWAVSDLNAVELAELQKLL